MARIKGGMNAKKKHNRVLKLAKGYRGARSKQYRVAKQSVMRALTSSYAGRELAHVNASKYILDDFAKALEDVATIDKKPKFEGRSMTMFLAPKNN